MRPYSYQSYHISKSVHIFFPDVILKYLSANADYMLILDYAFLQCKDMKEFHFFQAFLFNLLMASEGWKAKIKTWQKIWCLGPVFFILCFKESEYTPHMIIFHFLLLKVPLWLWASFFWRAQHNRILMLFSSSSLFLCLYFISFIPHAVWHYSVSQCNKVPVVSKCSAVKSSETE